MADDEDEEPTVALGAQQTVEGAPLARVSARLMWGIEKSAIVEREGETTIRTPSGPQELADLLDGVDQTYFATRQEFEDAVEGVVGDGPIPAEGADSESDDDEAVDTEEPDAELDDERTEADETAAEESEDDETEAESEETEGDSESETDEDAAETDSEPDDTDAEETPDETDVDAEDVD